MERRKFIQSVAAASAGLPIVNVGILKNELHKSLESMPQETTSETIYDVVVVGLGSMGSSTIYYASKRGAKVLGLEQYGIVHENGSHYGQSRIIRKAYFEHPDYVPLLERSYQNWKSLEEEVGYQLYYPSGLAYIGEPDHILLKGVLDSADKYDIPVERVSAVNNLDKLNKFDIPKGYQALFEQDAGFVTPEKTILTYTQRAIQLGAVVKEKEKVQSWSTQGDLVHVTTTSGVYKARKIIFTAGGFIKELLPQFKSSLKITRQLIAWVKPKKWDDFIYGNFPCWTIGVKGVPGIYYGFPILDPGEFFGPIGLKVAHHAGGVEIDPADLQNFDSKTEMQKLISMMTEFIPDAYESVLSVKSCLYTNSSDEDFIIDYLEDDQKIIVATGFSGHGFKFVPVVGEVLTDMALEGKTEQPVEFLSTSRF